MKATDFTLAWMQKFDFDGHPYKFSKIDLSNSETISSSTFSKYSQCTQEQLNNIMVILSDAVIGWNKDGSTYSGYTYSAGEILYMSNFIKDYEALPTYFGFGYLRQTIPATIGAQGTIQNRFTRLAGTFYIFDFNDNPV